MGQKAKYENQNPAYKFLLNKFLDNLYKAAISINAKNILDVGCAEGFVVEYFRKKNLDLNFVGIDVDSDALAEARKINPGIIFEERSIFDLGGINKKFDLVMSVEVIEHLEKYDKALDVLSKVDANYFLFSVPNEPFFRGLNFLRGKYFARFGNHPEHVNTWSRRAFRKILSKHFEIIKDYSSFPWTIILAKKNK